MPLLCRGSKSQGGESGNSREKNSHKNLIPKQSRLKICGTPMRKVAVGVNVVPCLCVAAPRIECRAGDTSCPTLSPPNAWAPAIRGNQGWCMPAQSERLAKPPPPPALARGHSRPHFESGPEVEVEVGGRGTGAAWLRTLGWGGGEGALLARFGMGRWECSGRGKFSGASRRRWFGNWVVSRRPNSQKRRKKRDAIQKSQHQNQETAALAPRAGDNKTGTPRSDTTGKGGLSIMMKPSRRGKKGPETTPGLRPTHGITGLLGRAPAR